MNPSSAPMKAWSAYMAIRALSKERKLGLQWFIAILEHLLQLSFSNLNVGDLFLSFPCIFDKLDLHHPVTDFFNLRAGHFDLRRGRVGFFSGNHHRFRRGLREILAPTIPIFISHLHKKRAPETDYGPERLGLMSKKKLAGFYALLRGFGFQLRIVRIRAAEGT